MSWTHRFATPPSADLETSRNGTTAHEKPRFWELINFVGFAAASYCFSCRIVALNSGPWTKSGERAVKGL